MNSSTLIASYLWKDTWKRWLEQPSSPLARLFVTGLLVLVATVILVTFHLLERSLRERLERFGLNTVLVRETVLGDSKELVVQGESPDRLAPLMALAWPRVSLAHVESRWTAPEMYMWVTLVTTRSAR